MSLYNRSLDVWPFSRYTPYSYHTDDELFVPSEINADIAEMRIREFSEHQFKEKSYYLGISPLVRNRTPVHINTARMMSVWRSQRLDPMCPGVYFRLGNNKKIVAYEAYDRQYSSSYDRPYTSSFDRSYSPLDRSYSPLGHSYSPIDRTLSSLDRPYSTLNRPYSTLDRTYSTLDRQYSSLDRPYSTMNHQYSTLDRPYSTLGHPYSTLDRSSYSPYEQRRDCYGDSFLY